MSNKVKVVICGKDFTLQTAESCNYVFGLARTLESRIMRNGQTLQSKGFSDPMVQPVSQSMGQKNSSLPRSGGAANVCSSPAGTSFGETPIRCMASTVSCGSTGNSHVSVQSNPQQSRQAAQVSGERIFRSMLSRSVRSSRICPESCPTEFQSGYHRSSGKPVRSCCC